MGSTYYWYTWNRLYCFACCCCMTRALPDYRWYCIRGCTHCLWYLLLPRLIQLMVHPWWCDHINTMIIITIIIINITVIDNSLDLIITIRHQICIELSHIKLIVHVSNELLLSFPSGTRYVLLVFTFSSLSIHPVFILFVLLLYILVTIVVVNCY